MRSRMLAFQAWLEGRRVRVPAFSIMTETAGLTSLLRTMARREQLVFTATSATASLRMRPEKQRSIQPCEAGTAVPPAIMIMTALTDLAVSFYNRVFWCTMKRTELSKMSAQTTKYKTSDGPNCRPHFD